jgi:CelD/BcsL family acetyltransferase involved in cellulose biosynthesis
VNNVCCGTGSCPQCQACSNSLTGQPSGTCANINANTADPVNGRAVRRDRPLPEVRRRHRLRERRLHDDGGREHRDRGRHVQRRELLADVDELRELRVQRSHVPDELHAGYGLRGQRLVQR